MLVISVSPRPLSGTADAGPLHRRLLEAVASVPGVTQAVDEMRATTGEALVLMPDKSGTAIIRKTRSAQH